MSERLCLHLCTLKRGPKTWYVNCPSPSWRLAAFCQTHFHGECWCIQAANERRIRKAREALEKKKKTM